jgi:tetratricopeptide (TPR) repeat protein
VHLNKYIEIGLKSLQSGHLDEADRKLTIAQSLAPENSDVLQLLGMLAKARGQIDMACDYLRQSLAQHPNQPHVLNNLANLLKDTNPSEAAQLYSKAITLKPDYVDALTNLADLKVRQNTTLGPSEALKLTQTALAIDANHALALDVGSLAALRVGDLKMSLALALHATRCTPNRARAWHRLGDAWAASSNFQDASQAYAKALHLDPMLDASWVGYSLCMRHLGNLPNAEEAAIRALEINSTNLAAHEILNGILWTQGRVEGHLGSYNFALSQHPNHPQLSLALAKEQFLLGRYAEAVDHLQPFLRAQPHEKEGLELQGRLALKLQDFKTAAKTFQDAIEMHPNHAPFHVHLTDTHLQAGAFDEARLVSEAATTRFDGQQDVLSRYALSLKLTDDPRYTWLCDFERLVAKIDLFAAERETGPPLFRALTDYLRTLHTAKVHPLDQTLRGGTQTYGQLFEEQTKPLIQQLRSLIKSAVETYLGQLPHDDVHPFLKRNTGRIKFSGSWSSLLSSGGYHTNHMHPEGWLSSACYIALPSCIADTQNKPGWFKLGQSNLLLGSRDVPDTYLEPAVGTLILFPSYMWHGTMPFEDAQERLTVAFDALPSEL